MAKKIKFALPLKDDVAVHTLDELREHFDLVKIIGYYEDGRLVGWLKGHYYDEEAEQVEALDSGNINADLCRILGVEVEASVLESLDAERIGEKNERIARLKQYPDGINAIDKVDCVAFDQKELDKLLKNGVSEIYLCNGKFTIPITKKNKKYIGIGKVEAVIRSKKAVDFEKLGISFINVIFDDKSTALALPTAEELLKLANEAIEKEDYTRGIEYRLKAAEMGSSEAMYALGNMYRIGFGVPQDYSKAAEWLKKASDAGNDDAMALLGEMYRFGFFFSEDKEEAIKWYNKALEYENTDAMIFLGQMYLNGEGVDQDSERAIELFEKAASKGDSFGWQVLGNMYRDSNEVEQDLETAIKYYEKAIEAGNTQAAYELAFLYHHIQENNFKKAKELYEKAAEDGISYAMLFLGDMYQEGQGVEKNISRAIEYYEKAAKDDEPYAMKRLGDLYRYNEDVQDYGKAMDWYKKAAENGNDEAMLSVGFMYDNGIGVDTDHRRAVEWYNKAINAGNVTAMLNLGIMYRDGEGVSENIQKALELFENADEAGSIDALPLLGNLYREGKGVSQDYSRAVSLYEQAADAGEPSSMFWLGVMYRDGEGVSQNTDKAIEWFQQSAEAGFEYGENALNNLLQSMNEPHNSNWYKDAAFLTEFIYRLHQSIMPFDKNASGFISVYSCDFSFISPISRYHDILKGISSHEDNITVIAVLEDRHPFSCGGIAFSSTAMYVNHLSSKGYVFMPYSDIQRIHISNKELKVLTRSEQSIDVYCDVWNPQTIKLFLSVAAGLKDFSSTEMGILHDIRVGTLGNRTVGEMIKG